MTFGSLFSGIGGLDLGLERAGWTCRWQCEIDPFCRRILAQHWPDVKRYEDVTKLAGDELEPVDLLCGGFPCQDVSQAGRRTGLTHPDGTPTRSGLWFEFARLIGRLRPRYVLAENTPGLLVPAAMRRVVGDLARLGYVGCWRSLRASEFGASHLRKRVFIVAYAESSIQEWEAGQRSASRQDLGRGSGEMAQSASPRWNGTEGQEQRLFGPSLQTARSGDDWGTLAESGASYLVADTADVRPELGARSGENQERLLPSQSSVESGRAGRTSEPCGRIGDVADTGYGGIDQRACEARRDAGQRTSERAESGCDGSTLAHSLRGQREQCGWPQDVDDSSITFGRGQLQEGRTGKRRAGFKSAIGELADAGDGFVGWSLENSQHTGSPFRGAAEGCSAAADLVGRSGRDDVADAGNGQFPQPRRGSQGRDGPRPAGAILSAFCRTYSVCHNPNQCDGNSCWLKRCGREFPDGFTDFDEIDMDDTERTGLEVRGVEREQYVPENSRSVAPGLPAFAPGPPDSRWPEILRTRPDLAPALEKETKAEPPLRGVAPRPADWLDRAMSNRTKRLSKLGNAVVPDCAEWVGLKLLEWERLLGGSV